MSSPQFSATDYVNQATELANKLADKAIGQTQAMQPMMKAFSATAEALAGDPRALVQNNLLLWQGHLALAANWLERLSGKTPPPVVTPEKDDKRFASPLWNEAYFDVLKQSYLLTSNWVSSTIGGARGLDDYTRAQSVFFAKQFTDLLSPSNFLPTNPEAIQTAISTGGQSLIEGFKNLIGDMQRGRISMTDYEKYKVGENIATTKGEVVFRNKLIELIQYTPSTPNVKAKPLLIAPPWINRFYILDLQPANSFVKYMVDQGYQVFLISWKNPDSSYRDVGFEDYMTDGLLAATDVVREITGEDSVNAIGYCIGGTLTAATAAYLNSKNDKRLNSVTFFTTLVDFEKAGELKLFTDEAQLAALEKKMQKDGILDGRDMAATFAALRANDLVWSFVVNNYLMGKQPFPFDLLYWNDDSTRMPCKMHSWYLRELYLNNSLAKGNVSLLGTKIDVTNLTQPLYMVAAINDHITPWESCYGAFNKMKSKNKRLALTKAGHVAGVVSPPTPAGKEVKRSFWAGEVSTSTQSADAWQKGATATPDSWWPDFAQWLSDKSGADIKAPTPGSKAHKPICPAPGTYVKER